MHVQQGSPPTTADEHARERAELAKMRTNLDAAFAEFSAALDRFADVAGIPQRERVRA